jgi:CubicO group peptidase (beta-lactamase class C family)
MTKPFTAVALMMLADEGKVKLDDRSAPMCRGWTACGWSRSKDEASMALKRQTRPITLRHLLSHTSGLPF